MMDLVDNQTISYLKFGDGPPDDSVQLLGRHSDEGEVDEITVDVQCSNGTD